LATPQTLPDLRIVRTEGGLLSGTGNGIRVYKRIPFAAPPVGPRRWRPPEAAHRTLPFGSRVTVTNPQNGKSVTVVINDRGPFTRGFTLDLGSVPNSRTVIPSY
jgi:rare lipoprotein A